MRLTASRRSAIFRPACKRSRPELLSCLFRPTSRA